MKRGRSVKHRILLVDDDQDLIRGACLRLQAAGYEAIEAHNGRDGLAAALEQPPDAILLDVQMPEMDGIEALAELQAQESTKNIPVVMLSASISEQQKALDAGARIFVKKPYQGNSLVEVVRSALNERRE